MGFGCVGGGPDVVGIDLEAISEIDVDAISMA
jgi:hypothetical protein